MAKKVYNADLLTGGGSRALDSYLIADLVNGDRSIVFDDPQSRIYEFDTSRTDAENSPFIIRPNDYGAGGLTGVWVQKEFATGSWFGDRGGLMSNNSTDLLNDIDFGPSWFRDSTNTVTLRTTSTITKRADAAFVAGTGNGGMLNGTFSANTAYFGVLMGDGDQQNDDFGFLNSADIGSISTYVTSAGFDYYKIIGFLHTIGSAQWAKFVMNGDYVICSVAGENVLSNAITTTAATVDHSAMIIDDYCEMIMYGARDGSIVANLQAMDNSSNIAFIVGQTNSTTTNTYIDIWGDRDHQKTGYKPYSSARRFKSSTGTIDLLLHGYKIKR
jgi:hypothetical protein